MWLTLAGTDRALLQQGLLWVVLGRLELLAPTAEHALCCYREQNSAKYERRPCEMCGAVGEVDYGEDPECKAQENPGSYERPDLCTGKLLDSLAIAFEHDLP